MSIGAYPREIISIVLDYLPATLLLSLTHCKIKVPISPRYVRNVSLKLDLSEAEQKHHRFWTNNRMIIATRKMDKVRDFLNENTAANTLLFHGVPAILNAIVISLLPTRWFKRRNSKLVIVAAALILQAGFIQAVKHSFQFASLTQQKVALKEIQRNHKVVQGIKRMPRRVSRVSKIQ